jgi:hypothetical protein
MIQLPQRVLNNSVEVFQSLRKSTTVAFIIFVLVGLITVYVVQSDNIAEARLAAITACERGNELRRQINERGDVTRQFMIDAAKSREHQARISRKKGNEAEAVVNETTAAGYRIQAKAFKDLRYVACEASYDHQYTIYEDNGLPTRTDKSPVKPKTSTQPTAKGADS